ncbi:MAG: TonB-dependent receptor [Bernardetiaceae bacterium]|nr:TonB-dependent receptor [Bernardetiaceae bacterium]
MRQASLLVRDSVGPSREFGFIKDGAYQLVLKTAYRQLVVEVKAIGHQCPPLVLTQPQTDQLYQHNFVLVPDSTRLLKEVEVKSQVPFHQKNDTLTYDLAAYTDGSEQKVLDILKKLPGLEVDEKTGAVKYQGRGVQVVNLDGDDLFGSAYTIGTKNINARVVEGVQVIDNYSSNPVLKDLEKSGKVALNLHLKKNIADYSGDLNGGAGGFGSPRSDLARSLNATLLGVSAKYKSFGMAAHNNIGTNYSTFDYFALNQSQLADGPVGYYPIRLVPEVSLAGSLDEGRANINRQMMSSYNFLTKPAKYLTTRVSVSFVDDLIRANQRLDVANLIGGAEFATSDGQQLQKRPRNYQLDGEAKYHDPKRNLYIEYRLATLVEQINIRSEVVINDQTAYQLAQRSANRYMAHTLQATKKLGPRSVGQLNANFAQGRLEQQLDLTAPTPPSEGATTFAQTATSQRSNLGLSGRYLYVRDQKLSLAHTVGASLDLAPIATQLTQMEGGPSLPPNAPTNQARVRQQSVYYLADFQYKARRLQIGLQFKPQYLGQRLDTGQARLTRVDLVLQPKAQLKYKLGKHLSLTAQAEYLEQPFGTGHLYPNQVYLSARGISRNQPELRLQRLFKQSAGINYADLYANFQANVTFNYTHASGDFIASNLVSSRFTITEFAYLPLPTRTYGLAAMAEKLVAAAFTVRLRFAANWSNYYNYLNASALRNNQFAAYNTQFFLKTAFKGKLNLETDLVYRWSVASAVGGQATFRNAALANVAKVIFRPVRPLLVWVVADVTAPNLAQPGQRFAFYDLMAEYRPPKTKWGLGLSIKNLANTTQFTTIEVTDFATQTYRRDLLPRHGIIRGWFNF